MAQTGLQRRDHEASTFGSQIESHHTYTLWCALFWARSYWARQLAEEGLIGIVLSQSPEYVAPHGSSEAVFGTNPIGVGVPAEGGPVVLDMATSAIAYYALVEHSRAGQPVPGDVGYDASGAPTTDPTAILNGGAIRTFDRWILLSTWSKPRANGPIDIKKALQVM